MNLLTKRYKAHYDIFTVGAGYLDVAAALESSELPYTRYNSRLPKVVFTTTGGVSTGQLVHGSHAIWVFNSIWGCNAIWGADVANDDAPDASMMILTGGDVVTKVDD